MIANEALMRRLQGVQDSRSTKGILSRGKNVYNGGTSAANNQKDEALRNAALRRMRKVQNWRSR